jgi:hypothetical protein
MEPMPPKRITTVSAPAPGAFQRGKLLIWLVCCVVLGLLMAWAAVVARGYAAPLVLFPLIVGSVLGGSIVLVMRVVHVGHRPTVWLGALAAGLLTVTGEHYFTFQKAQRLLAHDPDKLAKLHLVAPERIPPANFPEFMAWSAERGLPLGGYTARGGGAWLVWSIDGLLVLLPTVVLAGATAMLPYCNGCGRWYRTVRSGRIDSRTAKELSSLVDAGLESISESSEVSRTSEAWGRYRLTACEGGCGPTGFILSGEDSAGRDFWRILWLDAAGRQRIVEILDQMGRTPDPEP